jgi:plastocyanin
MIKKILVFCLGIIISGVIIFACSKSNETNTGNGDGDNNPPPASGNKVSIAGMSFSASSVTVTKGTTVTWTNNDNVAHTVTADDNSFDSGNIAAGATYSHTFGATGTVNYHCTIHTSMKGSVVVN